MITVSVTVTDNIPDAMKSLMKLCAAPPVAEVGLPSEAGAEMVKIGAIQEFGAGRIPKRSFLIDTLRIYNNVYTDAIVQGVANGVGRSDADQVVTSAVKTTARYYHRDIIRRIDDGINPRNAPYTIRRKGFDHPLIETGAMRKAIMWRMR